MLSQNARVYVAGHTGLIGSAVLRALERGGIHEPIVRDHAALELRDATAVQAFFEAEHPEYVVLAAGRVGGIVANRDYPADFITENLAVQLNVLTAAHREGVRRVIFFGSSCMYPRQAEQPMEESLLLSGKPESTSMAYAMAKLAGLEVCLSYNRQYGGARFVPVIPNSVYGENDNFDPARGHVLSALLRRFHEARTASAKGVNLWGTGTPRREFLFSDDLATACVMLLDAELSDVDLPLNIGPGADVSIAELADIIARVVGYEGKIEWDSKKPDGAPRKLLNSGRMRSLGWHPEVDLEEGIRRTYAWYCEKHLETATA